MSSINQRLCWDAGNTLGWHKAPGRAETSALWTPSSWKPFPHHDLLKEQPGCCSPSPCPAGPPDQHSAGPPSWRRAKPPPRRPAKPTLCQSPALQAFQQAHQASTPPGPHPTGPLDHCSAWPLSCRPATTLGPSPLAAWHKRPPTPPDTGSKPA
jgi:hypothetical protein